MMDAAMFEAISFVVGIIGGCLGAYVGMKVGLTRLETWREIISPELKDLRGEVAIHGDDLLAHDMEIGTLMDHAGLARLSRQRIRD